MTSIQDWAPSGTIEHSRENKSDAQALVPETKTGDQRPPEMAQVAAHCYQLESTVSASAFWGEASEAISISILLGSNQLFNQKSCNSSFKSKCGA